MVLGQVKLYVLQKRGMNVNECFPFDGAWVYRELIAETSPFIRQIKNLIIINTTLN